MAGQGVPNIFSARRRAARISRAEALARGEGPACWLLQHLESEALDRVDFMRLEPSRALLIGLDTRELTSELGRRGCEVTSIVARNEEAPVEGGPYDLIVSLAGLDTVNDLPGALVHLRAALSEGGLLLAPMIGAGSLPLLRQVLLAADGDRPAARIHPQVDNRAATSLLERAGFSRQVVDTHRLSVRYGDLDRLIADLRDQGLTNVLADPPPPLTRSGWERARAKFAELTDREGRATETFEILTLTGWR
ncbi:methyltransferase domain-containing protein [Altererythrobacter arenosus]|uniref:Methyltransferase domain-containing protein n=1 Tax=Altererythrobacter arenosus TaxID=3032592 RepID=A0ABY8FUD5_9SPHN|nr:methyltransferase domain-containing protein [Altererythrobacter sp. CAU 1644]WFL77011.1 methyltransferase domain-containing protein [Altererythrobacter sp. CAU 1644]